MAHLKSIRKSGKYLHQRKRKNVTNYNYNYRYRLVRHTWSFNVNESLSLDVNCTLDNVDSDDLGIDVYIKNLNQVHHPLMTEISLSDLKLFCSSYKLNNKKINCE